MPGSMTFRYVVTGLCVTGCYVSMYPLARHLGLAEFPANTLAYGSAVALQYLMHALYTYGVSPLRSGQCLRFLTVIGSGFVLSTLVTTVLAPTAGVGDAASALLAAALLTGLNWVLFRVWVYRPEVAHEP